MPARRHPVQTPRNSLTKAASAQKVKRTERATPPTRPSPTSSSSTASGLNWARYSLTPLGQAFAAKAKELGIRSFSALATELRVNPSRLLSVIDGKTRAYRSTRRRLVRFLGRGQAHLLPGASTAAQPRAQDAPTSGPGVDLQEVQASLRIVSEGQAAVLAVVSAIQKDLRGLRGETGRLSVAIERQSHRQQRAAAIMAGGQRKAARRQVPGGRATKR